MGNRCTELLELFPQSRCHHVPDTNPSAEQTRYAIHDFEQNTSVAPMHTTSRLSDRILTLHVFWPGIEIHRIHVRIKAYFWEKRRQRSQEGLSK